MTSLNPRLDVNFTNIDNRIATFLRKKTSTGAIDYLQATNSYNAANTTQAGFSAAISANRTAKYGAAGDRLLGQVVRASDDTVTIAYAGFLTFSYVDDATAPVLGRGVVCDGAGGVRIASAGTDAAAALAKALERGVVVDLDSTNLLCTVAL